MAFACILSSPGTVSVYLAALGPERSKQWDIQYISGPKDSGKEPSFSESITFQSANFSISIYKQTSAKSNFQDQDEDES